MKLQEIQTLVWPQARKALNTKTAKFWYIHYISSLVKDQERKITEAKYNIIIYTFSKITPQIHYIPRDIIPPS